MYGTAKPPRADRDSLLATVGYGRRLNVLVISGSASRGDASKQNPDAIDDPLRINASMQAAP